MFSLQGRNCVIAGATGNIGVGAVKALAEAGMNVAMVTHDFERAAEICKELEGLEGRVIAVSNEQGDDHVFEEVLKSFDSIDVVICNTGAMDAPIPLGAVKAEQLNKKLEHQVTNTFMMMQAAVPYLKISRAGRIILTSSIGAVNGLEEESMLDSISRGGILSMTYCLARQLFHSGITVNCIVKGGLINDHTPIADKHLDVTNYIDKIPLGTLGTATEFGALVEYIASEESAFTTGHIFQLDGGLQFR